MADVIHLEGFVAKDPESRAAGSHTITSVTVAVNQGRMKDGKFVNDTDRDGKEIVRWWETAFWNEHGDAVQHSVHKGDLVQIVGEPRPEVYAKNDGTPGLGLRIAGKSIAVVVRRPPRGGGQGGSTGGFGGGNSSGAANGPSAGGQDASGWAAPGAPFGADIESPF